MRNSQDSWTFAECDLAQRLHSNTASHTRAPLQLGTGVLQIPASVVRQPSVGNTQHHRHSGFKVKSEIGNWLGAVGRMCLAPNACDTVVPQIQEPAIMSVQCFAATALQFSSSHPITTLYNAEG